MNHPSYFEIQADDMQRALRFYQEVFGWTFMEQLGLQVEYFRIETKGPAGGLLKRSAQPPPRSGTNAFVCSMEVSDLAVCSEKILNLGGTVALAKFAVPGKCWQAYFLDTEGNTFGIFQVDPEAK
jgi:predicted enzyme related to lactoylglutathione lyase